MGTLRGEARPRRLTNAAGARTWINWTQYPDHGPDESLLGARCIGVDLAPGRKAAAERAWGDTMNLEFVTADAVDYLVSAPTEFDIIYSIFGAVWFTDPEILLPLVCDRLAAGGVFVFAQLPVEQSTSGHDRVIRKWNHPADQWVSVLVGMGFGAAAAEIIALPAAGLTGTLLVRAGDI